MKTLVATLSLLMLAFLPAPASAQCESVDATGAFYCLNADPEDTDNFDAYADQPGVGGASANRYEFSFMGMTQRGTSANAHAQGVSVGASQFCFVDRETGSCAFQDTMVFLYAEPAGFTMVTLSEAGDARVLCAYSTLESVDCVTLS